MNTQNIKAITEYIKQKKALREGFDQISYNLSRQSIFVAPEEVKQIWEVEKLPFKLLPQTIIDLRQIERPGVKRTWYVVQKPFVVYLSRFHPIVIPAGWETDMGSLPSYLEWWVAKDDPNWIIGFILHDILFRTKIIPSKNTCDSLLVHFAELRGAPSKKRIAVFLALRYYGHKAWEQKVDPEVIKLIEDATHEFAKKNFETLYCKKEKGTQK